MSGKTRPSLPEGGLAQDERGDERHRVGLEQVRRHPRAVADVVPHVVGDRRGVARIVLRDSLLDLADKVGSDVGGLGEDAAADAHEHGEQGSAEPEALQHRRRVAAEDEHHARGTEQSQADGRHAHVAAGPERDPGRDQGAVRVVGGGGDADVRAGREPHPQVADGGGEHRPDDEEHGPADPYVQVPWEHEQQEEHQDHEARQGAELTVEIRRGAFLDGPRDGLHVGGAHAGGQYLAAEHRGHDQCGQGDESDDDHIAEAAAGQRDLRAAIDGEQALGHPSSLSSENVTVNLDGPRGRTRHGRGRARALGGRHRDSVLGRSQRHARAGAGSVQRAESTQSAQRLPNDSPSHRAQTWWAEGPGLTNSGHRRTRIGHRIVTTAPVRPA